MFDNDGKLIDVVSLSAKNCIEPIRCQLRYATKENFLGRSVEGYSKDAEEVGLVTIETAKHLCKAQDYFVQHAQASIIIYDSLRPLRAVKDFARWLAQPPANDYELLRKKLHYPHLNKNEIAKLGYVATDVSRHCYGNVIDVSLVRLDDGSELNMGAIFDYFDEISHTDVAENTIGREAYENRKLLKNGMQQFGFSVYSEEFWHFEYFKREVDVPFDFEINAALRGLNVT